ncbi:membrane protein insertion efficiency factor YidD [Corynebacterium pseudodiphtheriticum]|nr:membrane protein insertion efficiency factor YidD [Corynebacterium pseudodiphtheriticum]MDK8479318.1 membrane protein insertion efficiency factor YidD [Corynebacterium pseudodiphtheriticum]UQV56201.1 membrane protein insertion efficiency factor YidD [Corynebacterium pseudodiphtheriticum]
MWKRPHGGDLTVTYYNTDGEAIPAARGPSRLLVAMVRFYQKNLSSQKPMSTCRFEPTCSAYSLEVFARHGAFKGLLCAIVRISKCGPWHPGGYDPASPSAHLLEAPRQNESE